MTPLKWKPNPIPPLFKALQGHPTEESKSHETTCISICLLCQWPKKIYNQKYRLCDINKYDSVGEGLWEGISQRWAASFKAAEIKSGYSQIGSVLGMSYTKDIHKISLGEFWGGYHKESEYCPGQQAHRQRGPPPMLLHPGEDAREKETSRSPTTSPNL